MAAGTVIAAAAAAAQKQAAERADAAWAPFAKTRAMNFRASRVGLGEAILPRVGGNLDGVSVAFEMAMVASDWGITAVSVPLAPVPVRVELGREGFLQKVAKVFGAQDIVLGDAPFDKAFMVRGTNDPGTHAVLGASTRSELLALDVSTLLYDDGSTKERGAVVVLGVPNVLVEAEALDRMLRLLVALAKTRAEG